MRPCIWHALVVGDEHKRRHAYTSSIKVLPLRHLRSCISVEVFKGLHLRHLRHLEDIAAVHGAVVVHEHDIALLHGNVHLAKIHLLRNILYHTYLLRLAAAC